MVGVWFGVGLGLVGWFRVGLRQGFGVRVGVKGKGCGVGWFRGCAGLGCWRRVGSGLVWDVCLGLVSGRMLV